MGKHWMRVRKSRSIRLRQGIYLLWFRCREADDCGGGVIFCVDAINLKINLVVIRILQKKLTACISISYTYIISIME